MISPDDILGFCMMCGKPLWPIRREGQLHMLRCVPGAAVAETTWTDDLQMLSVTSAAGLAQVRRKSVKSIGE